MVCVNIIKALGTAGFKSIHPKMLTSSRVRGIHLINKSYFCVINKTTGQLFGSEQKSLFVYDLHPLDFSDCYPYNYSTCI